MFSRFGPGVIRRWALVISLWLIGALILQLLGPRWDDITQDGDFAYLPAHLPSVQGERLLDQAFPDQRSRSQIVLVAARRSGPLTTADLRYLRRLAAELEARSLEDGPVTAVLAPWTPWLGAKLQSPLDPHKGQAALLVAQLRTELMAVENMELLQWLFGELDRLRQEPDFPADLQLEVTGSAAIGSDMLLAAQESIRNTEVVTIILVILILAAVYRAPGLVLLPVLAIAASVSVATSLLVWAAYVSQMIPWFDYKIFKTTRIFIVVLLFGAGIDYCLFLIARYREELRRCPDVARAGAEALTKVGSALAASALTTVLGLGTMIFCQFGKFRNSGPGIAVALLVALLACVTLAPSLLRAFGLAVFWPWKVHGRTSREQEKIAAESARSAIEPGKSAAAIGDRAESRGVFVVASGGNCGNEGSAKESWSPGVSVRSDGAASSESLSEKDSLLIGNRSSPGAPGLWWMLGRLVTRYPIWLLCGAVAIMAPLVWRGLQVEITYDLLSELSPSRPSVQGTRLLREYFPPGEIGPLVVLAYDPNTQFDETSDRWQRIRWLTEELRNFVFLTPDGHSVRPISVVRSWLEPLGERPERYGLLGAFRKGLLRAQARTKSVYLSTKGPLAGHVVRFDLVTEFDPFAAESMELVAQLENYLAKLAEDPNHPWFGVQFALAGPAAGIRDLQTVTSRDRRMIQWLVPLAVFIVLVAILGRPGTCVYLVFSVLWGYFVTMGSAEWLFQTIYGETYQGLDWKVPMFLFVLLVAVGQDYNIYLVTRVFEEQKRYGPLKGIEMGLAHTGGIITSCGIIMAGTFASMISGTLRAIQELGFALSAGILLDTFVIRTILVPAFLAIRERFMGRIQRVGVSPSDQRSA